MTAVRSQSKNTHLVDDVGTAIAIRRPAHTPSQLVSAVAESILIPDCEYSAQVLGALKAIAVRLTVDDFDSGCSLLSYLRRIPIK
jgi:diguanylate cyclase